MTTPVLGVDISRYQTHEPDLTGLSFVIAKASEGNGVDPMWAHHSAYTLEHGLALGAYHFGRAEWSVPDQVDVFLRTATKADFLVLDLERATSGSFMPESMARAFIRDVQQVDKRQQGLYGSQSNPNPPFPGAWRGDLLGADFAYVAAPGFIPGVPYLFVQYSQRGLDRDRFNGTPEQFAEWLGKPVETTDPMTNLFPITAHRVVDLPAKTVLEKTPDGDTYTTTSKPVTLGLLGATSTHFQVADGDAGVYVKRDGLTPRTADINAGA